MELTFSLFIFLKILLELEALGKFINLFVKFCYEVHFDQWNRKGLA